MGKKGEGQFDYNNGDTFTGEFKCDFDDDFNKILYRKGILKNKDNEVILKGVWIDEVFEKF